MITIFRASFLVFHNVRILPFLVLNACTYNTNIEPGDNMNLTASQITTLTTSRSALGSFEGQLLSNIQQDELEPGEYTVQFQIVEPVIDGLGSATYAYVYWKVDGQQVQRIISVFSGSVISGVANSVHVHLLDQSDRANHHFTGLVGVTNGSQTVTTAQPQTLARDEVIYFTSQPNVGYPILTPVVNATAFQLETPFSGLTGPTTAYGITSYKVAVALSKGTRAATMQPPVLLTQNFKNVAIGGQTNVFFPPDAGIISVLATVTVNGANIQVEAVNGELMFFDANGNALTTFIPASFPFWYPVPPGSIVMVFLNHSTTQTLNFSFQWGIEG